MEYSELKKRHFGNNDTDKKLTDNVALDLINRQKSEIDSAKAKIEICAEVIERQDAEIERLKECPKCVYEYDGEVTEYCIQGPCPNFKTVEQIKTEAYKEFAGIIKDKWFDNRYDSPDVDFDDFISNLLKEMVGERRMTDNQEAEKALEKMK